MGPVVGARGYHPARPGRQRLSPERQPVGELEVTDFRPTPRGPARGAAALSALRHRNATGDGQHLESRCSNQALQTTGYLTPARWASRFRVWDEFRIAAPANTYECRDGRVLIGVLLDSQWARLARLLGRPELASAPGYATIPERLENRAAVNGLTAAWARELTVEAALTALVAADVPAAKVQTFARRPEPAVLARDMLQTPDGAAIPITGPAAKLSRTPLRVRSAAPPLGAHNDEILDELGISAEERLRLREQRIL